MPEKIRIIGVPMDLGASRRGVDMGPSALRVAGLQTRLKQLGRQVEDIGNVPVPQPEEQHYGEKSARYLAEIAETCKGLAETVERRSTKASSRWFSAAIIPSPWAPPPESPRISTKQSKRIGMIWLDAHGDMNTPDIVAFRQRPRNAARRDHGLRAGRTRRPRRHQADG